MIKEIRESLIAKKTRKIHIYSAQGKGACVLLYLKDIIRVQRVWRIRMDLK